MLKPGALAIATLAAFWPVWVWYWQRLTDPSDEPLGALALVTLVVLIVARRVAPRSEIPGGRLVVASAVLAAYCLTWLIAPKMVHAILAVIVVGVVLGGVLPAGALVAGDWLLLLLSLPLVASLNFFVGYPLRLMVTQAALIALRLTGFAVEAQGTALSWNSQLVEVDAPCSGLKMLWFSLYLAATLAAAQRLPWRWTLLLLPSAAFAAVVANVLRVTSLFYLEAGAFSVPGGMAKLMHEGVGVSVFLMVAASIAWLSSMMQRRAATQKSALETPAAVPLAEAAGVARRYQRLSLTAFFVACAAAALMPMVPIAPGATVKGIEFPGFPTAFEGRGLRPVELPESQRRFFEGFPGLIGVFSDGRRVIVMRWVIQETRQLHPASDCYRGSGYAVEWLPLIIDERGRRWGRIRAAGGNESLNVRECIYDQTGRSWSDVSAWHWDALLGKSKGPWWAVTVVERRR